MSVIDGYSRGGDVTVSVVYDADESGEWVSWGVSVCYAGGDVGRGVQVYGGIGCGGLVYVGKCAV